MHGPPSRQGRSRPIAAIAVIALALLVALPPSAGARKFQMSGTWAIRNGSVFLPLQFAASLMGSQMTMTSMGDFTNAFFFPNGPIMGMGGVTATGSAPATLRVPRHRFLGDFMAAFPLPNPSLQQIATSLGVDAPFQTATLAPGGGPGSFTWCPQDADCVKMSPNDPAHGAGTRGGRIIYVAGPNRFGGSMAIGLRRGGTVTGCCFFHGTTPYGHFSTALTHQAWGLGVARGSTLQQPAPGQLGSADAPVLQTVFHKVGPVTQPTCTILMGMVVTCPGPKVTTMGGVTTTGTGPPQYLTTLATGPNGTRASMFTTSYGFGHTTGTVVAQQTTGTAPGDDFFTFMGTDLRTPLGAGNIQSVAGGIAFRHNLYGDSTYASVHKVWLTLGPPVPSLSPAGLAAAAALVLLAVGYALRRRVGR